MRVDRGPRRGRERRRGAPRPRRRGGVIHRDARVRVGDERRPPGHLRGGPGRPHYSPRFDTLRRVLRRVRVRVRVGERDQSRVRERREPRVAEPRGLEAPRDALVGPPSGSNRERVADDHELRRAIRYGTGSFAIESQRSHIRATHLALDSLYGLGPDHSEHYPSELERVTPADVLRVAGRIFRLDAYTVGAVHP